MKFVEGHKRSKGRPKGSTNIKTDQWNELSASITGKHAESFNDIMNNLSSSDDLKEKMMFVDSYLRVLNYFKPKSQNINLENAGEDGIKIKVTYEKIENK